MTYRETIDFLYDRLPMFSRVGSSAYKKDLDNTYKLCSFIGDPQKKFKSVHIAGTNGKGSVSHMLAAVFQSAGYKTGLYTSPHLRDFRERIRVNGGMVSESFVIDFTEKMRGIIDQVEPSFFELTVAMAFEYFAEQQVDIAVIETGLGGRLDSTNIIIPELSVITNIGWDHMNLLGNSLESIATEKAGIIKHHIPVVIGETQSETKQVFIEKAAGLSSPIFFADNERMLVNWNYTHHMLNLEIADQKTGEHQHYRLDLPGFYQTKNLLTVLSAIDQLKAKGWKINQEQLHQALSKVRKLTGLHGRWEQIRVHPAIILDVAHNEAGIRQVITQLELEGNKDIHIVVGIVKDKDTDRFLSLLPGYATYYFTRADIPRAMPEEQLKEHAARYHLSGNCYPDVNTAIQSALNRAEKNSLILVCGSVFLVGEVDTDRFRSTG